MMVSSVRCLHPAASGRPQAARACVHASAASRRDALLAGTATLLTLADQKRVLAVDSQTVGAYLPKAPGL
jgi:hypothetical protein